MLATSARGRPPAEANDLTDANPEKSDCVIFFSIELTRCWRPKIPDDCGPFSDPELWVWASRREAHEATRPDIDRANIMPRRKRTARKSMLARKSWHPPTFPGRFRLQLIFTNRKRKQRRDYSRSSKFSASATKRPQSTAWPSPAGFFFSSACWSNNSALNLVRQREPKGRGIPKKTHQSRPVER